MSKAEDYNRTEFEAGRLRWDHLTRAIKSAQSDWNAGQRFIGAGVFNALTEDGMAGPATRAMLVPEPPITDSRGLRALAKARIAMAFAKANNAEYGLGWGGKNVNAEHPYEWDPVRKVWRCDCSGMLAWCFGEPRLADSIYFYTDQLEKDAKGQVKRDLGDGIEWRQGLRGDIVVYGAGARTGHCGIVSESDANGPTAFIHTNSGPAPCTDETRNPEWWRSKDSVLLRIR